MPLAPGFLARRPFAGGPFNLLNQEGTMSFQFITAWGSVNPPAGQKVAQTISLFSPSRSSAPPPDLGWCLGQDPGVCRER
jgi:hypothetical protein